MAETQPMPDTIHSAAVRKLIETLRGWVRTRYRPGERLPTESSLARSFSRARGTVRKALAVLESEGMIHRKQGSGTYVSERAHRTTGTSGLLYSTTMSLLLHRGYTRAVYEGLVEGAAETERHVHLLMGHGERHYHRCQYRTSKQDYPEIPQHAGLFAQMPFHHRTINPYFE